MKVMANFSWVLLGILANNAAYGETAHLYTGSTDSYRVVVTSSLNPLTINRIHQWTVQLISDTAISGQVNIQITGGMPKHDHGLPTAPLMTRSLENDQYLIEGMKFHMRGLWVIEVNILTDNRSEKLTFELSL